MNPIWKDKRRITATVTEIAADRLELLAKATLLPKSQVLDALLRASSLSEGMFRVKQVIAEDACAMMAYKTGGE